jgi:hypothetical protein
MNDSIDFDALFAKNVRQLQTYLSDPLPLSDDRLFARRSYEEMLKNLNRRAQARDFDPNASEPRFRCVSAWGLDADRRRGHRCHANKIKTLDSRARRLRGQNSISIHSVHHLCRPSSFKLKF